MVIVIGSAPCGEEAVLWVGVVVEVEVGVAAGVGRSLRKGRGRGRCCLAALEYEWRHLLLGGKRRESLPDETEEEGEASLSVAGLRKGIRKTSKKQLIPVELTSVSRQSLGWCGVREQERQPPAFSGVAGQDGAAKQRGG